MRLVRLIEPHWLQKTTSTTGAIATGWSAAAGNLDAAWRAILHQLAATRRVASALGRVPGLLDGAAFIADFAARAVERETGAEVDEHARATMNDLISRLYVTNYAQDLDAAVLTRLPFLGTDRYISPTVEAVPYERIRRVLVQAGIGQRLVRVSPERLVTLREHPTVRGMLDDVAVRAAANGPPFTVYETAALQKIQGRRRIMRRLTGWPERALLSAAERYVEALSSVTPATTAMNTFNFHDKTYFVGNQNFGGQQHIEVTEQPSDALTAIRAVVSELVRSDAAIDALRELDALIAESRAVDSSEARRAAEPILQTASPSRRREIAEKLATGAGAGLIVQGILAAINAM
jgi:hypothetical protein